MAFKINFQLQEIDKIVPWGNQNDYMSWFGLTDARLWINIGDNTIYEYAQEAREFWNCKDLKYNDYYLTRFLEDFSETFIYIRESIPKYLYDTIEDFMKLTDTWKEADFYESDAMFDTFYDNEYEPLAEWFYNRMFDSGHLVGAPYIGCFRHNNTIKIYWESDYVLENGKSIWTAPKGIFEMEYEDFVSEVERFFKSFFLAMDKQVQLAINKDWGKVHLDKKRLVEEHKERKDGFLQCIGFLSHDKYDVTDWEKVRQSYTKMISHN